MLRARSGALGVLLCLASGGATAANVVGVAIAVGPSPAVKQLEVNKALKCGKLFDQSIVLAADGKGLQNVLVRVSRNAPAGSAPSQPLTLDQVDCMYTPRVQGAMEGQRIIVKNSNGILHNVHAHAGKKTLFNLGQPAGAPPIEKTVTAAPLMELSCDIHPWMRAYVVVSKHPYFSVTGADGRFELPSLPAGTYTLEAWHEKLGTQTAEVAVVEGKSATVRFEFTIPK